MSVDADLRSEGRFESGHWSESIIYITISYLSDQFGEISSKLSEPNRQGKSKYNFSYWWMDNVCLSVNTIGMSALMVNNYYRNRLLIDDWLFNAQQQIFHAYLWREYDVLKKIPLFQILMHIHDENSIC